VNSFIISKTKKESFSGIEELGDRCKVVLAGLLLDYSWKNRIGRRNESAATHHPHSY
jgi:hypothetical protein